MKKIDLKCSSCGANMQISDDNTQAVCPYCHYTFLIEKKESIDELVKKEEKLSYARKKGERKAIEDSIMRQKKRKFTIIIVVIAILFSIVIFSTIINYLSLEYMENPFECINVEFTGIDGEGQAKIVNTKKCENYSDINYIFSKENKLTEGESIRVTATSEIFRFGTNSKEYTVNGLSEYLLDLEDLTDDILNKLHKFSYSHLKDKAFGIAFSGEIVKLVPYKLYLYTNGENKNILYDVYKTSIKTRSGNVYDKFVVAYYQNFVILDNDELFSYSKLYHCGNIIKAGDPNEWSAMSKNYAGNIDGFLTIEDFRSYINKNNDGSFEKKER